MSSSINANAGSHGCVNLERVGSSRASQCSSCIGCLEVGDGLAITEKDSNTAGASRGFGKQQTRSIMLDDMASQPINQTQLEQWMDMPERHEWIAYRMVAEQVAEVDCRDS